jgi:glycosyltransferase involved in cell wall biosynthesis
MKIGIDVSQLAYKNTGVANYLENLVQNLLLLDKKNHYILFFSSLRKEFPISKFQYSNVTIKKFRIPPTLLDFIWNKLHIMPIENFIGDVDIFITSDWTESPTKHAKKVTILYDLIVYKYPKETAGKIVEVQKRKLKWVKKETDRILCISESTKKDAAQILGIEPNRLAVISAGI